MPSVFCFNSTLCHFELCNWISFRMKKKLIFNFMVGASKAIRVGSVWWRKLIVSSKKSFPKRRTLNKWSFVQIDNDQVWSQEQTSPRANKKGVSHREAKFLGSLIWRRPTWCVVAWAFSGDCNRHQTAFLRDAQRCESPVFANKCRKKKSTCTNSFKESKPKYSLNFFLSIAF